MGAIWTPANFGTNVPGSAGQVATGTNQSTAFQLTQQVTVFSTVAAGTGAALPSSFASGSAITVVNRGANQLAVYPAPRDEIEANGVGVAIEIPVGGSVTLTSFDPPASAPPRTWWETGGYNTGSLAGFLPLSGGMMTGPIVLPGAVLSGSTHPVASLNTGPGAVYTGTTTATPLGLFADFFGTSSVSANGNVLGISSVLVAEVGSVGGITGGYHYIAINGNSDTGSAQVEFVGERAFAYANFNAPNSNQSLLGRTTVAQVSAGVTGWYSVVGHEVATVVLGSAPQVYFNEYLMRYINDAHQGTVDAMLAMQNQYAQGAGVGTKVGLSFGPQGQNNLYFPVAVDGDILQISKGATDGTLTVANVINAAALGVVTGNVLNFPNQSLTADGSGKLLVGSIGAYGSGNGALSLFSRGNGGYVFSSTDGQLLALQNSTPGTAITSGFSFNVGAGSVGINVSGTNTELFIAANGTGAIAFQAGALAQIDHLGNVVATSYDVLSAGALVLGGTNATGITLGKSGVIASAPGGFVTGNLDAIGSNPLAIAGTNASSLTLGATGIITQILGTTGIGASGGPTITSGAGAPSSTQPNGSLYLRTNGAASTRLYVSEGGGTWSAIASS